MIVTPAEFDPATAFAGCELVPHEKKRRRGKNALSREVLTCFSCFDIETSTVHVPRYDDRKRDEHAFMYVWQWAFNPNYVVMGREWGEFLEICKQVKAYCLKVAEDNNLPELPAHYVFIHNLAFEHQFLMGIYPFRADECFFSEARKPLYARMFECIELRCSFRLSNMSLDKFCKSMNVENQKKSGQKFDYDKIRYPWTELTDFEKEYCINDVVGLWQAINKKMQRDGDTLLTLPLTSTGFVRRDCKNAIPYQMRQWEIKPMLPKIDDTANMTSLVYEMLTDAFRGGNTHAGTLNGKTGEILQGVESYDMASCYPAQQLTKKFPMRPFSPMTQPVTLEHVVNYMRHDYAIIAEITFTDLHLINPREPVPYLSRSKCVITDCTEPTPYEWEKRPDLAQQRKNLHDTFVKMHGHEPNGFAVDNGRVINADICTVTIAADVELEILLNMYGFARMTINRAIQAKKDYLPAEYRAVIQKYFNDKTELKGAEKGLTDPDAIEFTLYMYNKSKNLLNSVYGMSAQKVPLTEIYLDLSRINGDGGEYVKTPLQGPQLMAAFEKMAFPYQWGVYTTAYARAALQEGIDAAGPIMVYCDTDSIKAAGHVDFSEINARRIEAAKRMNAGCADRNGVMHYPGVFEYEGTYTRFRTWGAKRYAYEMPDKNGTEQLHVVVSGITKALHERYLENGEIDRKNSIPWAVEEIGGKIENFKPGAIWHEAGGTAAVYNDDDDFFITAEGKNLHITRNVAIVPTTYEMTIETTFQKLINISRYFDREDAKK